MGRAGPWAEGHGGWGPEGLESNGGGLVKGRDAGSSGGGMGISGWNDWRLRWAEFGCKCRAIHLQPLEGGLDHCVLSAAML